MELLTAAALLLVGLALLAAAGEALVRAATTLAALAGVSPAVIGLTVVAIGTSLPELVVSLVAADQGQPELAVANVVGSNIFNIAATLGVTALVLPLPVHGSAVRREWPFMFMASLLGIVLAQDGAIDRVEGALSLLSLAAFVGYTVHVARRAVGPDEARTFAAHAESRDIDAWGGTGAPPGLVTPLLVLAVGMALLVVGGRALVDGAVALARLAGMSERVIGLTIVAAGTGAPELATSLVAAFRDRADVAVANMIGSNIFNLLGILGVAAMLRPLPVSAAMLGGDMWWMVGTAALLLPLLRTGRRVSRVEGALLLGAYVAYVATLFLA